MPRERRFLIQTVLAGAGLVAALVGTDHDRRATSTVLGDGAGPRPIDVEGTLAVDGPTVFLWGIILIFALGGVLLFAERRLEGGVSSFAGQAAALPGTEAERQASTRGLEHTEVYPLLMFAVAGMMLFPAANDLLTLFVALEVLSLPLYLLCGLARRRRLLSQEAALKYFLLGAFSSGFFLYGVALIYGFAGSMEYADDQRGGPQRHSSNQCAAADRPRACCRSACSSRSAPRRSTPGPRTSTRAPRPPVTAFMAAGTKIAAFGALLRLFYVAFGSERWSWQPMLWVIAILTMVVGAVLAVVQTDMKRMLAYSSVAHTGFLLTGVLGVQQASELSDGQVTSMQAVLFYLTTYGFAMVGAFAVVTLVRDSGGEATSFARWQGLGRRSPLVAGLFAFFLLSMAGIPLTAGFVGQVGRLHGRAVGRRLAGGGRRDPVQHRRGVLLRAGDRADVLRRRRARGGEVASVTRPSVLTVGDHRRRRRARPSSWASCPARFSLSRPMLENSSGDGSWVGASCRRTRLSPVGFATGWSSSRRRWPGTSAAAPAFVSETAGHLMAAGGKRFRPLLVLLAAETGDRPGLRRGRHRGLRRRADPPRVAVPRRRDGRGRPAPRRRHRALDLGQPRRDPHRRLPVLEVLRAHRRPRRRTRSGSRRRPSPAWSRARSSRPCSPPTGEDPLAHYLEVVAGKTGSLIATSARYGARFGGATPEVEAALTAYGEIVGSAFQLSDDILDIASDSDESGKTPGTDLREGVPTLPVLMARAAADPADARLHRAARRRPQRRRPARRGARPAPQAPGAGRGPRLRRRPRPRGQGASSPYSPPARSATPSRPSPTWSPSARPEAFRCARRPGPPTPAGCWWRPGGARAS